MHTATAAAWATWTSKEEGEVGASCPPPNRSYRSDLSYRTYLLLQEPPTSASNKTPTVEPGERIVQPHGGYRNLKAYQMSEIVYDITFAFCNRFVVKRSRTHDQMVQAARSGKQNIAEGSMASGTSKKTELKLVGIARASLEELLLDYEDFIRQRDLSRWEPTSAKAQFIRRLAHRENRSYKTYETYIEEKSAETAANTAICVNNQTNYLLDKLKRQLDEAFLRDGGVTERIHRLRTNRRKSQDQ